MGGSLVTGLVVSPRRITGSPYAPGAICTGQLPSAMGKRRKQEATIRKSGKESSFDEVYTAPQETKMHDNNINVVMHFLFYPFRSASIRFVRLPLHLSLRTFFFV